MISIHAPPRGATQACQRGIMRLVFQFTPLREGRQGLIAQLARLDISIHAPPRGATLFSAFSQLLPKISIHAPPRGATGIGEALWLANLYFNSRPSARGDDAHAPSLFVAENISIHAPPRGATCTRRRSPPPSVHFNSRPSARGDAWCSATSETVSLFQFTPLREGRLLCFYPSFYFVKFQFTPLREGRRFIVPTPSILTNFNSRPSARGDLILSVTANIKYYFNSRPSARGDMPGIFQVERSFISIHAPPRGATPIDQHTSISRYISIHAPPRGATCNRLIDPAVIQFQFTPLREGRRQYFGIVR